MTDDELKDFERSMSESIEQLARAYQKEGTNRLQSKEDRKKAVAAFVSLAREAEKENPFVQLVTTLEAGAQAMRSKDKQAGLDAMASFVAQLRELFDADDAVEGLFHVADVAKEAFIADDYEAVIPPLFALLAKMRLTRDEYREGMIKGLAAVVNRQRAYTGPI